MDRCKADSPWTGGRNPAPGPGSAVHLWQVPSLTGPHLLHLKNGAGGASKVLSGTCLTPILQDGFASASEVFSLQELARSPESVLCKAVEGGDEERGPWRLAALGLSSCSDAGSLSDFRQVTYLSEPLCPHLRRGGPNSSH